MAQQVYAQFFAFLDQALLEEEIDLDWDVDPDAKPISTQAKGYAGVSKGSGKFTVNVTSACPTSGPEVNFIELSVKQTFVDMVVTMGTKQMISRGTITNVKGKGGASNPSDVVFTYIGSLPTVK